MQKASYSFEHADVMWSTTTNLKVVMIEHKVNNLVHDDSEWDKFSHLFKKTGNSSQDRSFEGR